MAGRKTRIGRRNLRVFARTNGVVTNQSESLRVIYRSTDGKFWRASATGRWQEVFKSEEGGFYCHCDYHAVSVGNAATVLERVASMSER